MATIHLERRDDVIRLTLARPAVRNAFDDTMIGELLGWAREAAADQRARAVVITGEGPSFCAGADLAWMERMRDYDQARNLADASAVADLFHTLATLPMPVIAAAHGAALGGGAGLLAVSDLVVAERGAQFGFTEARLGILPAVIAPYVVRRIGLAAARGLFLTARRLDAAEAWRLGLVDELTDADTLQARTEAILDEVLQGAPSAQRATKALLARIEPLPVQAVRDATAAAIAAQRVSDEGQEGLRAFFERRPPAWRRGGPDA